VLRFDPTCHVCGGSVRADAEGAVDAVGMAPRDAPRLWVWGPVLIHPGCRDHLQTPHDGDTNYVPITQRVTRPGRADPPGPPGLRRVPLSHDHATPNRSRTRPTAVAGAPGHRERDGTLMHDHDDLADSSTSRRELHGHERTLVAGELARRYHGGHSLHRIAADCGFSYGRVRQLLLESGVVLRPRGGARTRIPRSSDPS